MMNLWDKGTSRNCRKIVKGLSGLGVEFHCDAPIITLHIDRDYGQACLNRNAGEAAPTWDIRANAFYHMGRRISNGEQVTVSFDGWEYEFVGSHLPVSHIVRFKPDTWQLSGDDGFFLRVDAPEIPKEWMGR